MLWWWKVFMSETELHVIELSGNWTSPSQPYSKAKGTFAWALNAAVVAMDDWLHFRDSINVLCCSFDEKLMLPIHQTRRDRISPHQFKPHKCFASTLKSTTALTDDLNHDQIITSRWSLSLRSSSCANNWRRQQNQIKPHHKLWYFSLSFFALAWIACEKVKENYRRNSAFKFTPSAEHDEEWAERRSKKLFTIHWKSIFKHYCRKREKNTNVRRKNLFLLFFPVYLPVVHAQHNGKCLSRQFRPLR